MFEGDDPQQIIAQLEEAGFKKYDAQLYYQEIDTAPRWYIIGFNPFLFVDERRLRQRRFDKLSHFVQQKNQMLSQVKRSVNEAALRRNLDERLKGLRKFFGFRLIPLVVRTASGREVKNFQVVLEPKGENIAQAKLLDGVCAFPANHKKKKGNLYKYPASRVIYSYRDIERAFRNIKSFIQFNPVYVFKEQHVRAYYTICVPAYLMNISITNKVKAEKVVRDDKTRFLLMIIHLTPKPI